MCKLPIHDAYVAQILVYIVFKLQQFENIETHFPAPEKTAFSM